MALKNTISSNRTELSFAVEESAGVLQVAPVWYPLEPNSYDDFGSELTLKARNPINSSRQRKKGRITELEASAGFNQDYTSANSLEMLSGFLCAAPRVKATGAALTVSATGYVLGSAPLAAAFFTGALTSAENFVAATNNGIKVVTGVTAATVNFTGSTVAATGGGIKIVGAEAAAGALSVVTPAGEFPKIVSTGIDLTRLGVIAGEWVHVGDVTATSFATAANNGFKRVFSVSATEIVFDRSLETMVADNGAAKTIRILTGTHIRNELANLIVDKTYQLERKLGAPDTVSPNVQSEYVKGCGANELTINIEEAEFLTFDMNFVSLDSEVRTAAQGVKAGTRATIKQLDAFNLANDVTSMRLYAIEPNVANASPLFAYITEASIRVNNNIEPATAVGVLGGFELTRGQFEVDASIEAYFNTVEAIDKIRQNVDCGMFAAFAFDRQGLVIDLPLVALGGGQLDVEGNTDIKIPLEIAAATAVKVNPNLDYTLSMTVFEYLPLTA